MSLRSDLKILLQLARRVPSDGSHSDRLERFYGNQATGYDAFRHRLLHGRQELIRRLHIPPGGVWVDMGGGTGANVEHLPDATRQAAGKIIIVDLCPSMLEVAQARIRKNGWRNVETALADATAFTLAHGHADALTFSYSLTMIPDWFAAVDNARRLLAPDGRIGVVDFYVSRKHPAPGRRKHRWATRSLWPLWFAADNVFLQPDHLPYLRRYFSEEYLTERTGRIPYLFGLRAPYYIFIGARRKGEP